jgi:hypothetical protein
MVRCGLLALLAALALPAQETRESETVRYREIGEIIDEIARDADRASERKDERVLVVWMIDNASGLKSTRHHEILSDHIARAFAKAKPGIHHAVVSFAQKPELILKATNDARAAGRAIEWLADQKADDTIKNCLENIRAGAKYAAGFSGKKLLVVYTPENGDNEDNAEATLKFLRDTGVVLYPIAGEAIYSDPYWEALINGGSTYYGDSTKYKKLKFQMKGPESAYIEFPHGWILTTADPTYTVASGFGYWALDRLATHSGGKYFTYSPEPPPTMSFCQKWSCPICRGQHKACGAAFDITKLRMTAPSIESRDQVRERLSREKLSVAVFAAWDRLFKLGVVRNGSALRASGGGLSETKPQYGATFPLAFGSDWRAGQGACKRLSGELERLAADFEETLGKLGGPEADKRALATADALLVHVKLMRFNVDQLRFFCETMEEHERKKHAPDDGFGHEAFDDT